MSGPELGTLNQVLPAYRQVLSYLLSRECLGDLYDKLVQIFKSVMASWWLCCRLTHRQNEPPSFDLGQVSDRPFHDSHQS